MTIVRRILAAAAVAGALAVMPISGIANDLQSASVSIRVTPMGGQGSWPFKR